MSDEQDVVVSDPITEELGSLEDSKRAVVYFGVDGGTPTAFVTCEFHNAFVGELLARWKRDHELVVASDG